MSARKDSNSFDFSQANQALRLLAVFRSPIQRKDEFVHIIDFNNLLDNRQLKPMVCFDDFIIRN